MNNETTNPVIRDVSHVFRSILILVFALFVSIPLIGMGQTLDISSGIQTYVALTNTTVNLSGQCELHLTATNNKMTTVASQDAMPGCIINLNSPDAWFFLDGTRPYRVNLNQILVNGAAAVVGSNVRLVEYGMGAVVIAQSPSYLPLQVFSGSQFTGSSAQPSIYTFYTGTNAPLNGVISSFILKRGYAATFAQNADGTGISRAYVAADGDVKVGVLPGALNGAVQFVRVYPWIWHSKKGWAGGAGGDMQKVDATWNYDWNTGAFSDVSFAYAPQQWGGGYNASGINPKRGSILVLGYNEPDSASQANMTVAQATNDWPGMESSGLRLGSPACTDGGRSGWLYPFVSQIDSLGLRLDAAAIHMYMCGQTASSLRSWLWDIHVNTGRRIYITEFNNGANWTTCAQPTYAQEAQVIQDFITMMDNEPWIEGYNIYEWVQDSRKMVDTNGVVTPAGTNYLNKWSPLSYNQELSGNPKWSLAINGGVGATNANYHFNGDALDSSGNKNNALLAGSRTFIPAGTGNQALQFDGSHDYAVLPPNVGKSAGFTFAAWVYWNGGASFQRIFDLGYDINQYLFLTPNSGSTLRFAITTSGSAGEQRLETASLTTGTWTHVAVTISGSTGKLFINGTVVASSTTMSINPAAIPLIYSYLGKSQFSADPLFRGMMDEVVLNGYALSDTQVASLASTGQPPAMSLTAPSAPTGLSATAVSSGQINLSWTASSGATSYNVKRATVNGGPYTTVASGVTGASYSDMRANAGTTYFYVASAVNMNGESVNSTQASATTASGVPGAPTASATPNSIPIQVNLTWTVPLGGANTYNVKRSTTSGGGYVTIASGITTVSYTDTNVLNGTTYHYVVSGVNAFGEGANSAEVSVTPTTPISLNMPVTASSFQGGNDPFKGNDGSLNTRWTASAGTYPQWWRVDLGSSQSLSKAVINWYNSAGRSYQYLIEGSDDDVNYTTLVNNTNNTFFGDTTDNFSVTNRYVRVTVTGCPQGGFAAFYECSIYGASAPPPPPPSVPTGLSATAVSSSQINLSWTASSGATSYSVKRATTSGGPYTTIATSVTSTSFADIGLAPSTTYYYVVSAVNAGGESANSSQASSTTPSGVPAAPTGLTATAASTSQIDLTWTASGGATSYNVKRASVNGGPYTTIATGVTTTGFSDTALFSGTTYYYVVSAINGSGESANSTQASKTTLSVAPTGLTATAVSSSQINLGWTASSGATSYNVKRAIANGGPYTIVATGVMATTYSDTTAGGGTTSYYVVSAVNGGGESANSAQASATTVPVAPTGMTATVASSTQINLSWTVSTGAASYNLKRATANGGPYTTITNVTTTSYNNTGLTAGTTYYYVVTALNAAGESASSSQVSAVPNVVLLSQGSPATASSFQTGNTVANGNDGNGTTRWTAAASTYPQWWRVDLGSSQPVTKAVIDWYNTDGRVYKYKIETSTNDVNYILLVDKTGNTVAGTTTDMFSTTTRYVRITVTGCSLSGKYAAFWECKVYGN